MNKNTHTSFFTIQRTFSRFSASLLLLFVLVSTKVFALPIDEIAARKIAEQFFASSVQKKATNSIFPPIVTLVAAPEVIQAKPLQSSPFVDLQHSQTAYYIYNNGHNQGFVIVAADDTLPQILGYSYSGLFSIQKLPRHIEAFFTDLRRAIGYLLTLPIEEQLNVRSRLRSFPIKNEVRPLLGNIQWNQSFPYNLYTPEIGGEQTPVGCVATALAQVMRYHQWPERGRGSYSYDEKDINTGATSGRTHSVDFNVEYNWRNMPQQTPKKPTDAQKEALSILCFHIGVSLDMMYSADGSGTYTAYIPYALRNYFKYDKNVRYLSRDAYDQESWETIIRTELSQNRPIIYSGSGDGGGHAFVCDGYDTQGMFHINWGWGGVSDGYFELNLLNPSVLGIGGGSGGGFSQGQGIVVGITPDKNDSSTQTTSPQMISYGFDVACTDNSIMIKRASVGQITERSIETPFCLLLQPLTSSEDAITSNWSPSQEVKYSQVASPSISSIDLEKMPHRPHNTRYKAILAHRFQDVPIPVVGYPGKRLYQIIYFDSNGKPSIEQKETQIHLTPNSFNARLQGYEQSSVSFALDYDCYRIDVLECKVMYSLAGRNKFLELGRYPVSLVLDGSGQTPVLRIPTDRFPLAAKREVDLRIDLTYYDSDKNLLQEKSIPLTGNTPITVQEATQIRPAAFLFPSKSMETIDGYYWLNPEAPVFPEIAVYNLGTQTMTNLLYRFVYSYAANFAINSVAGNIVAANSIPAKREAYLSQGREMYPQRELGNMLSNASIINMGVLLINYENTNQYSLYPVLGNYLPTLSTNKYIVDRSQEITLKTARQQFDSINLRTMVRNNMSIKGGIQRSGNKCELFNSTITLSGAVGKLVCTESDITQLKLEKGTHLHTIVCSRNQMSAEAVAVLVTSLPYRLSSERGKLVIVDTKYGKEGNVISQTSINEAAAKNWDVYDGADEYTKKLIPATEGPVNHIVRAETEGKGTLLLKGNPNLSEVPHGTTLTIEARPDKGYQLVSLLANGKEILGQTEIIIVEETTIKAIFAPLIFSVILKSNASGTIAIDGLASSELSQVAYGTLCTVVPTGLNENCQLTHLYIKGKDIFPSLSFEVIEDTEVEAVFVDYSSTAEIRKDLPTAAFPNPTSSIVTIQGKPGQPVKVITPDGKIVLQTILQEEGELKVDLSKWTAGIYVVQVGNTAHRLIKR